MNNRAQVLVIFVILLPLLLLFSAYTVDIVYINYHKNKLDNINSLVVDHIENNPDIGVDDIGSLIRKNDENVVIKNIRIDEKIVLDIEEEIPSIFGRFIGKNKYKINSKIEQDLDNNKDDSVKE